MKKRILSSFLSLVLVLSLMPVSALAAEGPQNVAPAVVTEEPGEVHGEPPVEEAAGPEEPACICESLCTGETVNTDCPICTADYTACTYEAPADEQQEPAGEQGEPVGPTAEEQLTALIAALPDPADIEPEDEEQVERSSDQISEIYAYAEEHGLDAENDETINAVIMALYPVELLEYTAEEGTQENPWDISAEGEGNNITAYLEKNNGDESTPTYTLVISGSGAMADFPDAGQAPWYLYFPDKGAQTAITEITIGKDVTTIGANAFVWCKAVKNVNFEAGSALKEIHLNGFHSLVQLTSIELPASLVEIGGAAFYGCTALQTVSFQDPEKLTIIEDSAFGSCKALEHFNSNVDGKCDIPQNVVSIGGMAFQYCTSLTDVTIPAGVETLSATFYSCSKLTSVTFAPGSVVKHLSGSSSSDVGVFTATALTSIDLPDSVETIGRSCFHRSKLTAISIPARVQSIGINAFAGCPLTSVTFAENFELKEIGTGAFAGATVNEFIIPEGVESIGDSILHNGKVTSLIRVPSTLTAGFSLGWVSTSDNCILDTSRTVHQIKPYGTTRYKLIYIPAENQKSNYTSQNTFAVTNGGIAIGNSEGNTLMDVERNGYIFDGWYQDANFQTPANKNEAGDYIYQNSKTYYAKWVYNITFDANGGEGTMEAQAVTEGDQTTKLMNSTFTRADYTCAGWNTKPDGTGTAYAADAVASTVPNGTTLYAQWTKKIGESTPYTVNAIQGHVYTGKEIKPTVIIKSGETVLNSGYTVSYSNNIDVGEAKVTVTIGNDSAEVTFQITRDNAPTVAMSDVSVTYGTAYAMTAAAKTSAGNAITDGTITIRYYTNEDCSKDESETAPTAAGIYYAKATLAETDNYGSASASAKITIRNADFSVTAQGYDGTYDGQPHSITVTAEGAAVTYSTTENGTYSETNPTFTDAGEYTVYYRAAKANHNDVTGNVTVKIAKAVPAITISSDKAELRGGGTVELTVKAAPADSTVAVTQTDDQGSEAKILTLTDGTVSVKLDNRDARYTFTASCAETNNYTAGSSECTVTVSRRSSGGGGGSSSTTAETTTNRDGSKTTTVTDKKTGTVTETTKFQDGSILVVETQKDGTVTTTETTKNGVKIKTVDEPGEDVTAEITVPKSVGEAVVIIPADVDCGTVAVDTDTGEVVKLSVPTKEGMTVKLAGSAELVLVDRSRNFDDTRNHWAKDAINFVTAHELFSGTSDTAFTPDSPMTRAMLMTVLARFDGQDTTGGAVWYEKAMEWARENGISDGSDPDGSITREQLATMLWRYAGSPTGGGSLSSFGDSASVSAYALEAVRWAVGEGLISGTDAGLLAPQGSATRAQVATILMRFVESLTK